MTLGVDRIRSALTYIHACMHACIHTYTHTMQAQSTETARGSKFPRSVHRVVLLGADGLGTSCRGGVL